MATIREQALAALQTLLTSAPAVCANVARARSRPWAQSVALAINIVPEGSPRQETGGADYIDKVLLVDFQIHARGDVPDSLADPTVDALHNRLMSDRTLGGLVLDIAAGDDDFEWDDAERDYCLIHQRYQILYRTEETNLSL